MLFVLSRAQDKSEKSKELDVIPINSIDLDGGLDRFIKNWIIG